MSLPLPPPKTKIKHSHRACDACAIRKVKCGPVKPCFHCVSNNLQCTQLRQKKKSGPKNLHKKTLENISEFIESSALVAASSSVNSTNSTASKSTAVVAALLDTSPPPPHNNIASTLNYDVIEILSLIDQNHIVAEIVDSLTVLSLVPIYEDYIDVVRETIRITTSSPNSGGLTTQQLPMEHLSNLSVAYTLCLLTFETVLNMVELNCTIFNISKSIDEFKYLQHDLVLKVNEFSLVIETEIRLSMTPINQTIFYKHSLVFLHLYNYYQVCVLRLPAHRKINKFLHLRQAINYYLLLDESDTKLKVSPKEIYEVYEILFIIERLNVFLLDKNCLMDSNAVMLLNDRNFDNHRNSLDGKNQLFGFLKATFENRKFLSMFKFFNNFLLLREYNSPPQQQLQQQQTTKEAEFFGEPFQMEEFLKSCKQLNINVENLDQLIIQCNGVESQLESVYSSFMLIFSILIIFKIDMARTILSERSVKVNQIYLFELIERLNMILKGTDLCILKIKCHNFQLIPQLLTMLKLGIESLTKNEDEENYLHGDGKYLLKSVYELQQFRNHLIDFLHSLLALSPNGYNLVQYIENCRILREWYDNLGMMYNNFSTIKKEDVEEAQKNKLELDIENEEEEYLTMYRKNGPGQDFFFDKAALGIKGKIDISSIMHKNDEGEAGDENVKNEDILLTLGSHSKGTIFLSESSKNLLNTFYGRADELEHKKGSLTNTHNNDSNNSNGSNGNSTSNSKKDGDVSFSDLFLYYAAAGA